VLALHKWHLLCALKKKERKKEGCTEVLAAFITSGWDYGYNEHL
jgi:hypothetical protein